MLERNANQTALHEQLRLPILRLGTLVNKYYERAVDAAAQYGSANALTLNTRGHAEQVNHQRSLSNMQ